MDRFKPSLNISYIQAYSILQRMDSAFFYFRQQRITTHEGLGGKVAEIFKVFSRQQQLNYGRDTPHTPHTHSTTHSQDLTGSHTRLALCSCYFFLFCFL